MNDQARKTGAEPLHERMFALIPWYVNHTLEPEESAEVDAHLASCSLCRHEVSRYRELEAHMPDEEDSWKPSAAHFAGILAQVDALEPAPRAQPRPSLLARIGRWFAQTPPPMRWTLAVESMAVAALAVALVLPHSGGVVEAPGVHFETLSNAEPKAAQAGSLIRLVFSEDITEREMRSLLDSAGAQLRQGPSAVGAYTVEVPADRSNAAVGSFRAHPKVRLAEAVQPL